jgi:hypothetical protein
MVLGPRGEHVAAGQGRSVGHGAGIAVRRAPEPDATDHPQSARGIEKSARHRHTVYGEADRNAPLGDAVDELSGSVDGVDDPHARAGEPGRVVLGFFGEPALPDGRQRFAQDPVDGVVGLGDRGAVVLAPGRHVARGEGTQCVRGGVESGVDALQIAG